MNTEPTNAEYERYFELTHADNEEDLTASEILELERLKSLISPWMYSVDFHELAIENHGLIAVPETLEDGGVYTRWISDRFVVVPEHRQREIDGHTRFIWAILPFDEQPSSACSLFFEDGKFRRDEPERLNWPFDRWVYESIKARRTYKQQFGSEFPDSYSDCRGVIEKWIGQLNI